MLQYLPAHIFPIRSYHYVLFTASALLLMLTGNLTIWAARNHAVSKFSHQQTAEPAKQNTTQVIPLELGKPIERELSGGQSHSYLFTLNENQYANIVVEQNGIDIKLVLTDKESERRRRSIAPHADFVVVASDHHHDQRGDAVSPLEPPRLGFGDPAQRTGLSVSKSLAESDDDWRTKGKEVVEIVAKTSGQFQLNVVATHKVVNSGKYKIQMAEVREATIRDIELQQARKLELDAKELADVYKAEEAVPLLERAIDLKEKLLGYDHPSIAATLNRLSWALFDSGNSTKAKQVSQRALAIYKKHFGLEHQGVAFSLDILSNAAYLEGDYIIVMQLEEQALNIYEKVLDKEHREIGRLAGTLAAIYLLKGDFAKAEILQERSITILEKSLGEQHPEFASALNNLGYFYTNSSDRI